MIVWVLYDVQDTQVRNKIVKICKRYGLYRVQKSVFLGNIEEAEKQALGKEIEELINPDYDSVYIFPMSKTELKKTVLLGQAFDKKFVTDQVKALFL